MIGARIIVGTQKGTIYIYVIAEHMLFVIYRYIVYGCCNLGVREGSPKRATARGLEGLYGFLCRLLLGTIRFRVPSLRV